jgi:DNA-directed RNA polymerase specialized sigma24 family protein
VLIDRARRGGREVPLSNELLDSLQATPGDNNADGALPIGGDEAASPEAAEAAPIVERYLSELSPELRAVYHQRYELGLFQVAAATNLGLTRQMLRTLEDKLKKGLARAIKRGRSWPAAAAAAAVTPRPVELPVRADK